MKSSPYTSQLEKSPRSNQDQAVKNNNKQNYKKETLKV